MKRFNNKILFIILVVLLSGFVLTRLFRTPALESNLDADLLRVDTASVTQIKIYPKREKEITLVKEKNNWKVKQEKVTANPELYSVRNLLSTLAGLKPERMVSRKTEKWDTYEVGDTTGIKLVALEGNDELTTLLVGKEASGLTYIRKQDEDEVYAAEGYIRESINKNFSDWRDKTFLRLEKELIKTVTFTYPADSGFVIQKKNKSWRLDEQQADSTKVDGYLNRIRFKDLSVFEDDFAPSADPDVTVIIGSDVASQAVVKGWKKSFYQWVVTSDRQRGVYFLLEGSAAFRELFPARKEFFTTAGAQK